MIFYYDLSNINEQYHNVKDDLNLKKQLQNTRGEIILECLKNLNSSIPLDDEAGIENPQQVIESLESLKEILDEVRDCKYMLERLYVKLTLIFANEKDIVLTDNLKTQLEDYNIQAQKLDDKLNSENIKYENFILNYVKNFALESSSSAPSSASPLEKVIEVEKEPDVQTEVNSTPVYDNPILLISEKKHKVFLPYEIADLNKALEASHKYKTINELINNEYVVSLSRYNNPVISRFKETYNFMRKKENASFTESMELALELAFNRLLNPAIITACKNLDELDYYLDCLNSGEPEKFNCFKIEYEIRPI